jgi:hypothetical protein
MSIYKYLLVDHFGVHMRSMKRGLHQHAYHCPAKKCTSRYGKRSLHSQYWLWLERDQRHRFFPTQYEIWSYGNPAPPQKAALNPAILATCKQVYDEGLATFYGQHLSFADGNTLGAFIVQIGFPALQHLTRIRILAWAGARHRNSANLKAFLLLRDLPNLKRVFIDCILGDTLLPHGWRSHQEDTENTEIDRYFAKQIALYVYKDVYPWISAVTHSRGKDTWKEILEVSDSNFRPSERDWFLPLPPAWSAARITKAHQAMFDEIEYLIQHGA